MSDAASFGGGSPPRDAGVAASLTTDRSVPLCLEGDCVLGMGHMANAHLSASEVREMSNDELFDRLFVVAAELVDRGAEPEWLLEQLRRSAAPA